jgi:hypothetical protein
MSCHEFVELATVYLEGTLAGAARERFEAHARDCSACSMHLMEIRAVVAAAGRLRGPATKDPDPAREVAVKLFRSRGLHRAGAQVRDVPLGIGGHAAALGDHIAYLWESDREFLAAVGFLAAGVEREEACVLLGRDKANRRLLNALDELGLNTSDLRRHDRLQVASPSSSGDDLLRAVDDRVRTAVDRGLVGVRILGDLGWGAPGWPLFDEMLKLEARVTDAVRQYPCIALCAYDVGRLPARALLKGGFECHPTILHHDTLRQNDAYVPAEPFLAGLGGRTSQRRGDKL